jgi:hypothetical protein
MTANITPKDTYSTETVNINLLVLRWAWMESIIGRENLWAWMADIILQDTCLGETENTTPRDIRSGEMESIMRPALLWEPTDFITLKDPFLATMAATTCRVRFLVLTGDTTSQDHFSATMAGIIR